MKTIHLLLVLLGLFLMSSAQELPPVQNFDPITYKAGNQNWMIDQDDDGVIYAANNKGLLEFNGAHWKLYTTPNESITRSVSVHDKRIYTGCYRDFGFWERDEFGSLNYTSLVAQSSIQLDEDEEFWNIQIAGDQILFQSLSNLYAYDATTSNVSVLVANKVINKFFKVDNLYYYHVLDEGLYKIVNGKSILAHSVNDLGKSLIAAMYQNNGSTYLVTAEGLIKELSDTDVKTTTVIDLGKGLSIYDAIVLNDGNLALGTIANGVLITSSDGELIYAINQPLGLQNNTCLSLFQDAFNQLWIGLDNGISAINLNSQLKIYNDRNGRLGTVYTTYPIDDDLYLGTNQGLFVKNTSGEITFVKGSQGQVWNLDYHNDKLLCSHNNGLFVVENNTLIPVFESTGNWKVTKVPNRENLYIAGSYKGLFSLTYSNNKFVSKRIEGFSISSKDIAFENESTLYINHEYKGVFKLELNESLNRVLHKEEINELPQGIGSDLINYKGDVIYAKRDEVFVKKQSKSKFEKNDYLSKIVLSEVYTSATLQIENGVLWMFNKENLYPIKMQDIDGSYSYNPVPWQQENRNEKIGYENIRHLNDNTFLVGTSYGYSIIDVNQKQTTAEKPVITSIIAHGKEVHKKIALNSEISVPYEFNSLNLEYSVPNTIGIQEVRYRYRLDDGNFSNWERNASAAFENLNFGDYTLELQSQVNGVIVNEPTQLEIKIQRPGFLSNLAIVVYVLLTVLLIAFINGFYIWYYKRKKDRALHEQQKELELKNLENEKRMVELRNSKLRNDIELRNKELAVSTMAMIKKNETLNELKAQLEKLPQAQETKSLRKLVDQNLNSKQDWITFEEAFNNADKDFFKKIKERHPNLTSGDLRLCVYLRLNLSSKEIAPLLNISPRSVEIKRYRLRKKLGLDRENSLSGYIVDI